MKDFEGNNEELATEMRAESKMPRNGAEKPIKI